MILIYTGEGKGKTSACVGQAVRAHGQGLRVGFAQFMKRPDQAGEQKVLKQLLSDNFFSGGRGFFRQEKTRTEHRDAALAVLAWAQGVMERVDMLVLDESLYALSSGLLLEEEVRTLSASAHQKGIHLVLSGRGAPEWLCEEADLVTEMKPIKHHYNKGIPAAKGIEF